MAVVVPANPEKLGKFARAINELGVGIYPSFCLRLTLDLEALGTRSQILLGRLSLRVLPFSVSFALLSRKISMVRRVAYGSIDPARNQQRYN